MTRISVLGAGRMGGALVTAFAKSGHTVTVWNRSVAKAQALSATGARIASSIADAMDADLIVGIFSDYDASVATVQTPALSRALRGKTFLELASGTPKEAQRAAAWAKQHGIDYLDGAIMATPDFIGQPGCTILYSGTPELFGAHKETLAAIADNGTYVGKPIGHANVLDNAILALLWGTMHGLFQGAAICEAEAFPLQAFGQTLSATWPVVEPLLQAAVRRIAARHWAADETTQSAIAPGHVTARHILAISAQHGIDTGLPEAFVRIFQRAIDTGHRDDDIAAAYLGVARH